MLSEQELEREKEYIIQLRTAYIAMLRACFACDRETKREHFSVYWKVKTLFEEKYEEYMCHRREFIENKKADS